MKNYKKTFSGDKINYKFDKIYGMIGAQYILVTTGIMIVVATVIGYYNKYIETENLKHIDIIWLIICIFLGYFIIRLGINSIMKKHNFKKMYNSIKSNGKKAIGKIKKVYRFCIYMHEDETPIEYPEFILKITYYNEYKKQEQTFLCPKISGDAYSISDDKVIVYYNENNAVIDELKFDSENPAKFEEGIFTGTPDIDTKEYNDFLQEVESLSSKDKAMRLIEYKKNQKKKLK